MSEPKTALTGCLAPIDKAGLEKLAAAGKANPDVIKTVKCRTVAEGRFRHSNYIRDLPAYIVDEPPALLGDDTAPNPSDHVRQRCNSGRDGLVRGGLGRRQGGRD